MIRLLLLVVLLAQGRPLFYWGSRSPVVTPGEHQGPPEIARVVEIHAALDRGDLVIRLTLDRPVRDATHLPDGAPVSGRLQARIYLDLDGDPATGQAGSSADSRTGTERLIELATLYVGEDEEQLRPAEARVIVAIDALDEAGRRSPLWSAEHVASPDRVSMRGEWVELRLPERHAPVAERSRFVYATGLEVFEGRFRP